MPTTYSCRISFIIIFLLNYILLSAQSNSQKTSPLLTYGDASEVAMSNDRLSRIDSICLQEIKVGNIPGAVALVARHGKVVYHKAFGTASADPARLLNKDNIFRLASQTKAITSTGLMMLWEQGLFRLDDPISKYIPEFSHSKVLDTVYPDGSLQTIPALREITIRHLLTHTSGIGYGIIDGDSRMQKIYHDAGIIDLFTTQPITIADNIKKLATLPLHHHPGDKFTYGESIDVVGYLIEIFSGMPLDKYLRKHIFEPLDMHHTWFYIPASIEDRLVSVQTNKDGQWIDYPKTFYDPDYPKEGAKTYFSGGAGLSGTALDYAKFLQMYLNEGEYNGTRLLSRNTVRIIMANHIGESWESFPNAYHGLAFKVQSEEGVTTGDIHNAGTFMWGGYFNSQYFADPQEEIIGIIIKQTRDTNNDDTQWKFPIIVMQSIDD